jgi:hypothetical protein
MSMSEEEGSGRQRRDEDREAEKGPRIERPRGRR